MTTVDHCAPTVREGEFVESPTGTPPPLPPTPKSGTFAVRASALTLLGALLAAGVGVHRQPEGLEVAASAVFAAIVLFLTCVFRQAAQP
jgi:hypothetical protein